MSKLDELIEKLCPNGVEFKKLEEISNFERGKGFKKEDKGTGDFPIIFYGELYTTYGNYINAIYSFVDETKVKNKVIVNKNDLVLPISSTTAEAQIGKASVVNVDNVVLGSDAIVIHHTLNPSYLMYYINSKIFEYNKMKCVSGTTIRHLAPKEMMQIQVAVPPLEIQFEIVHILDDFTLLSAELSAELKARQKQYEFYRDYLIKETNKTEYKDLTLQDILKIKNGKDYKHLREGKYPVYGTGGIMTYVDKFMYDKPSVLIPRKGSLDKLYYVEEPFWNVDTIFYTEINEAEVIPKYVYYYLQNENLEKLNIAGGIPSLTQTTLNKVKIKIPSKEVQEKIINVLDNFDKICSDFNIGIPSEIEARQKQYEYYRDKLLNFKELKNEG